MNVAEDFPALRRKVVSTNIRDGESGMTEELNGQVTSAQEPSNNPSHLKNGDLPLLRKRDGEHTIAMLAYRGIILPTK